MPTRTRVGLAAAVGVACALAVPVGAAACTPDEYLTAEERNSGLYDTTPPDYYAGSDAPHTHGDTTAPAPAEAGDPAAPAPPVAGAVEPAAAPPPPAGGTGTEPKKRATKARPDRQRVRTPAPAAQRPAVPAPAPAPAAPAVTAPSTAPVVSAAPPAASPRATPRRAQTSRPSRRAGTGARAQVPARWSITRASGPRLAPQTAPEIVAARPAASRGTDGIALLPLAALAALLVAMGALLLLRRRRPIRPARVLEATPLADAIEAELQELLAEEHARRERLVCAGVDPDRYRP